MFDYLTWLDSFSLDNRENNDNLVSARPLCDGNNIYLRPLKLEDTDLIIEWRNDEAVRKYFVYQEKFTRKTHLNWFANYILTGKAMQFIVVDKKTNNSIGSVFLRDIDNVHKKAELGIFLGHDSPKGKGVGTEAIKLLISYAFNILHLHKIFVRIFTDNERSLEALKKANLVFEGTLHGTVKVNGKYRDMALMSIVNE